MHITLMIPPALSLLVTATAVAGICDSTSPNFDGSDAYYRIEQAPELNRRQQRTLAGLVDRIDGRWQGRMTETVCRGSAGSMSPQRENWRFDAELKEGAGGALVIELDVTSSGGGRTRPETLTYLGESNRHVIRRLTPGGFEVIHEYRNTGESGSIHREDISELKVSGNSMTLTVNSYLFGRFAYRKTYDFHR